MISDPMLLRLSIEQGFYGRAIDKCHVRTFPCRRFIHTSSSRLASSPTYSRQLSGSKAQEMGRRRRSSAKFSGLKLVRVIRGVDRYESILLDAVASNTVYLGLSLEY